MASAAPYFEQELQSEEASRAARRVQQRPARAPGHERTTRAEVSLDRTAVQHDEHCGARCEANALPLHRGANSPISAC
ncbi:hypothetical protein ACU4GD_40135 [Cupriavidus basilensis]